MGILVKSIYDNITDGLKENEQEMYRLILKFIDKNSEVLNHNIPSKRLYFSDEIDRLPIYNFCNITPKEIKDIVNSIPDVKSSWKLINDPFNILMLMVIRYYTVKNNRKMMEISLTYLILSLYSSLQYKSYRYPPNEAIMEYTFNRLSTKFYFKKYKTILNALLATGSGSHEKYANDLKKEDDTLLINYFVSLRSRLNNQMRMFANEYYKDYKEGNTMFNSSDSSDVEDFHENGNISSFIVGVADKVSLNFSINNLDVDSIKVASSLAKTDPVTLKNALLSIKEHETAVVKKLIILILQAYLKDTNNPINSVGSKKFITYTISIYSKSNTKDVTVLEIKDILDSFLSKHSSKYSHTEREATKGSYRKALFTYFVLIITNYVNS